MCDCCPNCPACEHHARHRADVIPDSCGFDRSKPCDMAGHEFGLHRADLPLEPMRRGEGL